MWRPWQTPWPRRRDRCWPTADRGLEQQYYGVWPGLPGGSLRQRRRSNRLPGPGTTWRRKDHYSNPTRAVQKWLRRAARVLSIVMASLLCQLFQRRCRPEDRPREGIAIGAAHGCHAGLAGSPALSPIVRCVGEATYQPVAVIGARGRGCRSVTETMSSGDRLRHLLVAGICDAGGQGARRRARPVGPVTPGDGTSTGDGLTASVGLRLNGEPSFGWCPVQVGLLRERYGLGGRDVCRVRTVAPQQIDVVEWP